MSKHSLAVFQGNGLKISNPKLQKVMFFALLDALKDGVDIEYDNLFVAWRYGAVIPEDYHYYKKYGCLSILDSGEYFEDFSFLDKYILNYAGKNTHSLEDLKTDTNKIV